MAYAPGERGDAIDYNDMVGTPTGTPTNTNKILQPFVNSAETLQKMAGLYGVGYGDTGYGQTAILLPNVVAGVTTIPASNWAALRTAIETTGNHQGSDIANLVPAGQLITGQIINAHDGSNFSLSNLISVVDDNKFNTNSGASMTLTSNVSTDARALIWSGTISSTFRYTWSTVDEARFFFNSGGELRIRLTQGTVTTPQDTDWNDIFTNKLGTYSFKAQESSVTGTSSAAVIINSGYYDILNGPTHTLAFNGVNIGGSLYSSNDLLIHARVQGTAGNGGPGTQVDIQITLQDQHTSAIFDQVSAGTTNRTDVFRATSVLAGIVAPAVSIFKTFD